MTQDEKELLFKDLCSRLPYGVICDMWDELESESKITERLKMGGLSAFYEHPGFGVRPYLRSMTSMTEEEKKELKAATCPEGTGYFDDQYLICPMNHFVELIGYDFMSDILDWLNAHHFDYRNLIDLGLAREAKEGMYV